MSLDPRKIQLLMSLRSQGIRDIRVLEAIELVPRELFVEPSFADQSYADRALPIACGQTISQPFIVGLMTDRLEVGERHKVLEIGTGSGYQTAILSLLCRRVYTIERYRTLAVEAGLRFHEMRLGNITQLVGDGTKGWPEQAPFDRIMVTAAAKTIPPALTDQLAVGGIMVIPLEEKPGKQNLFRVRRGKQGYESENLLAVRFVALVEGVAKES
ncbi:MAG: protein-L-isoaspartate(D-aspartate) O-methyltransferase [Aestuariivirga sp.]